MNKEEYNNLWEAVVVLVGSMSDRTEARGESRLRSFTRFMGYELVKGEWKEMKDTKCKHQYIKLRSLVKLKKRKLVKGKRGSLVIRREGDRRKCALCGKQKDLYEDR